jgi:DNA-binding transcriptional LysR family regulator
MLSEPGTPTLDQLRGLHDGGGDWQFRGGGTKTGPRDIGHQLLSRQSGGAARALAVRPTVDAQTPAHRRRSNRACGVRTVANGINGLRAKVRGLLQGIEAEICLVLDVMLPVARVVDALKAFHAEFPTVSLRLYMEALGAVMQMVLSGAATVGVGGPFDEVVAGIDRVAVGTIELIPVAAPDHPMALAGYNAPGAGRGHVQLVLTDRSSLTEGKDLGVYGSQTWRLADLGSKHMLLKEGIGWGYMPEPMVREDIAQGRLVRLDMPELKSAHTPDCLRSTALTPHPAPLVPG